MIYTYHINEIKKLNLKKAINYTCKNRHFEINFNETLDIIENSVVLKNRWVKYSQKHTYAKNIEYKDVIDILRKIVEIL